MARRKSLVSSTFFLTSSYTGFFGLAGHGGGGGGDGIHHTFITLVLFDGFELNWYSNRYSQDNLISLL